MTARKETAPLPIRASSLGAKIRKAPGIFTDSRRFSASPARTVLADVCPGGVPTAYCICSTMYRTILAQFCEAASLKTSYSMLCEPSDLSEMARITTKGVAFR